MSKLPPSFFFLIYFITGIFLQRIGGNILYIFLIFLLSLFVLEKKYLFLSCFFLLLLILGFYLSKNEIPNFEIYNYEKINIKGIIEEVDEKVKIKEIIFKPLNYNDRILFVLPKDSPLEIGDVIFLEEIKIFPLERDNIFKFWEKDISFQGKFKKVIVLKKGKISIIYYIRNKVKKFIKNVFSKNSSEVSAFLRAIILGETGVLPKEIKEIFITTGTAHILAISGLHITLLVSILTFFFKGTIFKLLISLFLFFYALLIGNNPPVWRAVLMYFYMILAKYLLREEDIFNSLFMVSLISLLFSPLNIFNISFQLSYFATLGLIISPSFKSQFFPKYFQNIYRSSFFLFIFLFPFNIYFFQKLPILSFISNFFSIPIFQIILISSFFLILIKIFHLNFLYLPICTIIEFFVRFLFLGLQWIINNYKISLVICIIIILFPFLRRVENDELLGI